MAHESIMQEGWSDTLENQCHLLNAICTESLVCEINRLCEWAKLSEEEGWSLFGLETVKQVLEEGQTSGLGPNVLRPFCHGFGIQKRRDKTFQTFERRSSSNYRIPKGFKTIPKNFQLSTRF